jgi:hypothetical protein
MAAAALECSRCGQSLAVGLEHTEGPVLHLAAGAPAGSKLGYRPRGDRQIGEAVVRGSLSRRAVGLDGKPVGCASFADGLAKLLQFGVVRGLADGAV